MSDKRKEQNQGKKPKLEANSAEFVLVEARGDETSRGEEKTPQTALTQTPEKEENPSFSLVDLEQSEDECLWQSKANELLMHNYAPALACLERGEGVRLLDSDGNEYLDFLGGIAVNSLGYAHPSWIEAATAQIHQIAHASNFFVTKPELKLAKKLLEISGAKPGGRVLFCNSGAEANEGALKLTRLWQQKFEGKKPRVLALENAFHGRTMGSLSLTYKKAFTEPFAPLVPGVEFVPPTVEALTEAVDDQVAALFVEPIQGESGVLPLPDGFLKVARKLTQEHQALLIIDEVQTGVARTGRWFAYQYEEITPDAVTMAKGLAGGLPIGALVSFASCQDLFYPGSHGTTFGGNPVSCHAALAVLDTIVNEDLLGNATARFTQIQTGLNQFEHPLIQEVRGRGLLIAVVLTKPVAKKLVPLALAEGLIINAASANVIRLAPPLIITAQDTEEFLDKFQRTLEAIG